MKKGKTSPKLKQMKITSFWSKPPDAVKTPSDQNATPANDENKAKKRRNSDCIEHSTPKKFLVLSYGESSPDLIPSTPVEVTNRKSVVRKDLSELFTAKGEDPAKIEVKHTEMIENTPPSPVLTPAKSSKKSKKEALKNRNDNVAQEKIEFENFDFDFDEFNPSKEEFWWEEKSALNFSSPRKCKVVKTISITSPHEQTVLVLDSETNGKGICKLRDVWAFTELKPDDSITIKAVETSQGWIVDSKNGFLSLFPEMVISSTSIVGAMFCMRKGILSSFFRGYDSGSKIMVIGQVVHEILQRSLKTPSCTFEDVGRIIDEVLSEVDTLKVMYGSDMTVEKTKLELMSFVPQVMHFLSVYVKRETAPAGDNFKGTILEILDIEESVAAPKLGMKGRIDVTAKVAIGNQVKVMPLELKTGRASFSNEHRSQVTLYTMMMTELGGNVDSGLLLYLREGILSEIVPTQVELRDMVLLRNQLVRFAKDFKDGALPEPIRMANACSKCAYLPICTSYLKINGLDKLSDNHPIRTLIGANIKESHIEYFSKWSRLVMLEDSEDSNERRSGIIIDGLTVDKEVLEMRNEFKQTLRTSKECVKLEPMTPFFVSTSKLGKICNGKVISANRFEIVAWFDKKIEDVSENYKLETYKSTLALTYLSNLGCFLNEEHEQLREIIIEKRKSHFKDKFDKKTLNEACIRILKPLNDDQRRAVLKVLTSEDYLVIRGPPGTGKTHMIVALIKILLIMEQTVLLTGHTHSSVDNILLRLGEDIDYLRFGALKSCNVETHSKSFVIKLEKCKTIEEIEKLYKHKLIASTCLGIDSNLVQKRKFDVCIVDESSQVMQPEVLKPLFCSKKFILIGDSNQLPPVVRNRSAKKSGLAESLFERLENDSTVSLRLQYRMNKTINDLANKLVYNELLECGNEAVANGTLALKNKPILVKCPAWIRDTLSVELAASVIFLDTSWYFATTEKEEAQSCQSAVEAKIILELVNRLLDLGIEKREIGVIAPYRAQVELLVTSIELPDLEVNTVDQYQGRDKEVVLFSCTRENQSQRVVDEWEILNDKRRLTVALTRAKHKLVVVGDKKTAVNYKPLEDLLKCLPVENVISLKDGERDFFWSFFRLE